MKSLTLVLTAIMMLVFSDIRSALTVTVVEGNIDNFKDILQYGAYGNATPPPGNIEIDAEGNVSISGQPPTNEFGKILKRIIDDPSDTVHIFTEKSLDGKPFFLGGYRRGLPPNIAILLPGNGEQSINLNHMNKLPRSSVPGGMTQQAAMIHELYEAYIAKKYFLVYTRAHDSANTAEGKVIGSQSGSNPYERTMDGFKPDTTAFDMIHSRTDSPKVKSATRIYLNMDNGIDSVKSVRISNYTNKYVVNGHSSGGLYSFNRTDEAITLNPYPNTSELNGVQYMESDDFGRIYVSIPLSGKVKRLKKNGTIDLEFQHTDMIRPKGISHNSKYFEHYVVCEESKKIFVFNDQGIYLRSFEISGLNLPAGMDTDYNDNLFVSSHGNNKIFQFTRTGVMLDTIIHPMLQGPADIEFIEGTNELYAVCNTNNKILIFDRYNNFSRVFAPAVTLESPWGIKSNESKRLKFILTDFTYIKPKSIYVTNASANAKMIEIDMNGSVVQNFNAPNIYPSAIAIDYSYTVLPLTGIEDPIALQPEEFSLHQNYPNPFNPETNIVFDINKAQFVRLAVYDITGRELQVLYNEKLTAGSHEVRFDGSSLNSGVYFYKLTSDEFTETKKMILLK